MEFLTAAGKKVVVNIAPYQDAMELKSCIFEEISKSDIKIELSDLRPDSEIEFGQFFKTLIALDASRKVRAAIESCLVRCTYDSQKITPALFDSNEEARDDYYQIVFACLKVNLRPFLKGLASTLSTSLPIVTKEKTQKS